MMICELAFRLSWNGKELRLLDFFRRLTICSVSGILPSASLCGCITGFSIGFCVSRFLFWHSLTFDGWIDDDPSPLGSSLGSWRNAESDPTSNASWDSPDMISDFADSQPLLNDSAVSISKCNHIYGLLRTLFLQLFFPVFANR